MKSDPFVPPQSAAEEMQHRVHQVHDAIRAHRAEITALEVQASEREQEIARLEKLAAEYTEVITALGA